MQPALPYMLANWLESEEEVDVDVERHLFAFFPTFLFGTAYTCDLCADPVSSCVCVWGGGGEGGGVSHARTSK